MPIWMRTFHIKSIKDYLEEVQKQKDKARKKHKNPSKQVMGPNITPSSTYTVKK